MLRIGLNNLPNFAQYDGGKCSTYSIFSPIRRTEKMNKKSLIKEQFGANAAAYVTSKPHAKGASLARLVELVEAQPHWRALDIATAAGHTALAFAPHVAHVTATDITPEMLPLATQLAEERGLENITVEIADAEELPYDDGTFDLVTCRIAPHHFTDIDRFLTESARVLGPKGILAVVDNIVPEGKAGAYVNAFEKRRDPSHGRCLSLAEWIAGFEKAGFTLLHQEILVKQMEFESWAARHTGELQQQLRAMLDDAPQEAAAFLRPQRLGDKTVFHLQEGLIVGRRT